MSEYQFRKLPTKSPKCCLDVRDELIKVTELDKASGKFAWEFYIFSLVSLLLFAYLAYG